MLGNLKEKLSFRVNADWVGENFDFEGERGIKKVQLPENCLSGSSNQTFSNPHVQTHRQSHKLLKVNFIFSDFFNRL